MRKHLLSVFIASLTLSSLALIPSAWAGSPYDTAPNDLKSYESALLKKLVTVKWGQTYGVGFAGSYSIAQETLDKGINSLIVTTASTLSPNNDVLKGCFLRGADRRVTFSNSEKTFQGECMAWNGDGSDFAIVATSVTLPTIPLWDAYWPKIDGWIDIAYYVDGFGIVLRPSRIKLINEKLYVFALEKVAPELKYGGLAFNSLGNFVGTVSPHGPGLVPSEYLKLNGAPLQCPWENSNSTITNCSTRTNQAQSARTGVWTIDSPSSTPSPTPSPKTSSDPVPNELKDANEAVETSLSAVTDLIDSCNAIVDDIKESLGEYQVATSILSSCDQFDSKFIEIEGRRAQAYEGSGSASTRVKTLNSLTDQALALADSTEKHLFELQSSKLLFAQITQDLNAFSKDIEASAEAFANLNNRISGLPKATQTMIWKNSNFKKLKSVFGSESDIDLLLQENLPDLKSISTFTQLKNAPKLISKAKDSRADILNSSQLIKSIEKLIPKFVCVKGKIISVTPATGKCAPGATKTSTS